MKEWMMPPYNSQVAVVPEVELRDNVELKE